MRNVLQQSVVLCAIVSVIACGSSPTSPGGGGSAAITLTANPNPIAGGACQGCGSQSTDREAITALTIQETGGVGGTVNAVAMVLRENGTNAVIASGEFDSGGVSSLAGSSRLAASGVLIVRNVGVHYPREQAGKAATLTYTVRLTDDRGNQVTRDLAVAVSVT